MANFASSKHLSPSAGLQTAIWEASIESWLVIQGALFPLSLQESYT